MKYTDPYSGLFGGRKLESIKMTIPEHLKTALTVVGTIFVIGLLTLAFTAYTSAAYGQTVVVSDEEYKERCGIPNFSPRDPGCADIRPRSAPLDCSQPDFSPRHPYCTPDIRTRDGRVRCDGFSPLPPECIINELY